VNPNDPNVAMMELVAERLGERLREEMVFVGGAVAGLWYPHALATAQTTNLPSGTPIRLVTAPVFLATKFEAFADRGGRDYLFSHDLGDLISVIDGRDELTAECRLAEAQLKSYLRDQFRALLAVPAFIDALPGHLPGDSASQGRLPDLEDKLRQLAELN
jgi:hypothetical protein